METSTERALRYDLERAEDQLRQVEERLLHEQDERRREGLERIKKVYHSAYSWPEALRKQSHLFASEVGFIDGEVYNRETDYFAQGMDACKRASEVWAAASNSKQAEVEQLKARLAQIEMQIRVWVADTLDAERQTSGWTQVASVLRDETADPGEWLNW